MRAALLVSCAATAAGSCAAEGCARSRHDAPEAASTQANADASSSNAGIDASALDAAAPADDDDDDHVAPVDASIDAPYGVIACPLHGAHPKLPDGGVDLTGLLTPVVARDAGTGGGLIGIGVGGLKTNVCGGCGMGGPRPGFNGSPHGSVALSNIQTNKGDLGAVTRALMSQRAAFRVCYANALLVDPSQQGALNEQFTLSSAGAVTSATTTSNRGLLDSVGACVTRRIRNMTVQDAAGATIVVQMTFTHD